MPDQTSNLPLLLGWALAAAVGGWVAGWVSATVTGRLAGPDEASTVGRLPTAADPVVQGALALCWAALAVRFGVTWQSAAVAVLAVPLVQIAVTDWRTRWVYTVVAVVGGVAGILLTLPAHPGTWPFAGVAGAIGGYLVFSLIYWLGKAMYRGEEPLAHGDVTIAGMVGAMAGPNTATALVVGVVVSGLLAIALLLIKRDRQATMPYGPGLCVGGLVALFLS